MRRPPASRVGPPRDAIRATAEADATSGRAAIRVRGMYCRRCEDVIVRELMALRGVIEADASWLRGLVTLTYDPAIATEEQIGEVLSAAGYPCGAGLPGVLVDGLTLVAVIVAVALLGWLRLPGIPLAAADSSAAYLFVVGLATSTHCVIMCGGLMLSQTSRAGATGWRGGLRRAGGYNLSRVASCTLLGAAFGAIGATITYTAWQRGALHALAGAGVLLVGLAMWGVIPDLMVGLLARRRRAGRGRSPIVGLLGSVRSRLGTGALGIAAVGALNALLPCGASYTMWLVSSASGSPAAGALAMFSWSAGTMPLMLVVGALASAFPARGAAWAFRANVVLVVALGVRMLISGLRMIP